MSQFMYFSESKPKPEPPGGTTPVPTPGSPAECPSHRSLGELLQRYQALLGGKLDHLAIALQNTTSQLPRHKHV
ncbi:unnamed protein product [Boreogadus saida]